MFGTRWFSKSRLLVSLMVVVFILSGLPARLSGRAYSAVVDPPAMASGAAFVLPVPAPSYDLLLQDDSSGDMLRWSSTTGEYLYTRCANGFALTGTGTITAQGSIYTLTHNGADRRVQATLNNGLHSGTASVQYPLDSPTYTIVDKSSTPNPGATDAAPPQVIVTSPNGGELVDADTSFTITWTATDSVGINKQDVLLSTDGGTSFSPIVTGLAGTVNQYNWLALATVNNQNLRVRVIAYDAACNVASDDSDASFRIVNNGAFPHVAESPIFMSSGGFQSVVHLCIHAENPVTVELAVRNRYGTALAAPPSLFILVPDIPRAIDVATLLMPGAPPPAGDANISMGSLRLRHNGAEDSSVLGVVAVSHNHEETSFIVPLAYAASTQLLSSTTQCSPLFYLDRETSALLTLQNVTNAPVVVGGMLHYGTGAPGTPGGTIALPTFTLAPQQTFISNLSAYRSQMQGAEWGSITLNAPGQTVIAQMVMMSRANELAFASPFIDPAMYTTTTRVASTLKLDYKMDMKACLMVCNTSSADTRTVTATFKTDNGVVLPARQVTLGPGQQTMIELNSRSLLAVGTSTRANVTLNYSGNTADIVAGAVSMSPAYSCAIPAQLVEMLPGNSRQLLSPFFYFDERTSGILQISNSGASDIKAGAKMEFSDTTLPSLNTDLITVPAHGTATVDLQSYFSRVDDTVKAQGCLELIHNGAPGTVAATFSAIGTGNNLSFVVPLVSGPAYAAREMELFPNNVELLPGEGASFAVITGESLSAPNWSVSANIGSPGSITPGASIEPYVYPAAYVSSTNPNTVAVTLTADATGSGGPIQTGIITLAKVKVIGFKTTDASGVETGGRLNPDGDSNATQFIITGKNEWPVGELTVRFKQGTPFVPTTASRDGSNPKNLIGVAPMNMKFVGDCQIVVLQNGTKISKDKTGAAYYAYDPPTAITGVQAINPVGTADGFNRLGGILNVNGIGFRKFGSILPDVDVGGLDFTSNTLAENNAQINGLVGRATNDISSCAVEGQTPCKFIKVRNPGHRSKDKTVSLIPLYNLKIGPPPIPTSRVPDFGPSMGGTQMLINGDNMDFVDSVSVGGSPALIDLGNGSAKKIIVTVLPHLASTAAIILNDIDQGSTTVQGGFQYRPTAPLKVSGDLTTPWTFILGPGEAVMEVPNTHSFTISSPWVLGFSVTITRLPHLPVGFSSPLEAYLVDVTSFTVSLNIPPGNYTVDCTFKIGNSTAPMDQNLWRTVTQRRTVQWP